MSDVRARRWMLALSITLVAAQVVDMVWPRGDSRAASPATLVGAVCLLFLLALYPNGRFTPRWTAVAVTRTQAARRGAMHRLPPIPSA